MQRPVRKAAEARAGINYYTGQKRKAGDGGPRPPPVKRPTQNDPPVPPLGGGGGGSDDGGSGGSDGGSSGDESSGSDDDGSDGSGDESSGDDGSRGSRSDTSSLASMPDPDPRLTIQLTVNAGVSPDFKSYFDDLVSRGTDNAGPEFTMMRNLFVAHG